MLEAIVFVRAWIKPDVRITAAPGEIRLEQGRLYVADDAEATAGPGTFLHTVWARDWRLRRRSLKLEAIAGDYESEDVPGRRKQVDLLISAGMNMRPGSYVAWRGLTAFKVRVRL